MRTERRRQAAAAEAARVTRAKARELARREQRGLPWDMEGMVVRARKRPIGHRNYDVNKLYYLVYLLLEPRFS